MKQGHVWIGVGISLALLGYLFSKVEYRQLWQLAGVGRCAYIADGGGRHQWDSGHARLALAIPAAAGEAGQVLELDGRHSYRHDGQYDPAGAAG